MEIAALRAVLAANKLTANNIEIGVQNMRHLRIMLSTTTRGTRSRPRSQPDARLPCRKEDANFCYSRMKVLLGIKICSDIYICILFLVFTLRVRVGG